ncbi:MAG: nickel pincer cofactor biosynthesis protein LarB [Actinomycetota bacterium]|nr:nickel pincer cofactor biosynthesis protein LarB [Actinomycetota bacterium]
MNGDQSTSGFAEIDHGRYARIGIPEAIYAPGKSKSQLIAIAREMDKKNQGPVLITRLSLEIAEEILRTFPDSFSMPNLVKDANHLYSVVISANAPRDKKVVIVTGGTTDLPVANEAAATLVACGISCEIISDVGIAGLHRIMARLDHIRTFDVVIVVAGMEGALASVLGGLISAPLIAVPTSTGYGASNEGATAMMAMLASCAPGIAVMGIDNGFGGACAALRIVNRLEANYSAAKL